MKTHRNRHGRRHAVVLVWVAALVLLLMSLLALAVDVGYVYSVRADLQAAADAAALAGASGLSSAKPNEVERLAIEYAGKNYANNSPVILDKDDVEIGRWDAAERIFTPTKMNPHSAPNAVRVTPRLANLELLFAKAIGINSVDAMTASAVAIYGSRDIMLVLDYSGSMNDDIDLTNVSRLGRSEVEQLIAQCWADLGSPTYGNMEFTPRSVTGSDDTILRNLGLRWTAGGRTRNLPYPYPNQYPDDNSSECWGHYLDYVRSYSDSHYRNRYGYLTLFDFWQTGDRPKFSQTPDLWKTHQQPLAAVKDAVSIFLAYMEQEPTDDRIGLASFTSANQQGTLEEPLTANYDQIRDTSNRRQAAHYHRETNIGAGIQQARVELNARGRKGAMQLIVLLSDGIPNLPGNESQGLHEARYQATATAAQHIPILTISLGANADIDLMQDIADITGGLHFVVPGGSDVEDYRDQLYAVFAQVAAHRPLRLVD